MCRDVFEYSGPTATVPLPDPHTGPIPKFDDG
jgi:hypothetical protein